ncbi:RlmE family RNA methyltransferase [Candidatus Peregrinibacteria bacterium]|nr:RlmE family RNA methyltransferase [Candidatus Peregrinibacteria bacterium]
MELDARFTLLRRGMTVLDLGAAPGSWLQYTAKTIGPKGVAIGIDLQEIEPIDGVKTHVADILDRESIKKIIQEEGLTTVDLVLSDLAPSTSGIRDVDQWHSVELSQAVTDLATEVLKPGGTCVIKVLRGADFDEFHQQLKKDWKSVKIAIPDATRDRSKEVYVVLKR